MSSFKLQILTPFGQYFNGEVEYLSLSNSAGVLGILPHHIPLVTDVVLGKVIVVIKGNRHTYATTGGVLNIEKEKVTLMLNTIERSDEIDVDRAKKSKERAEKRIESGEGNLKRAQDSLKRANNRLDVADKK